MPDFSIRETKVTPVETGGLTVEIVMAETPDVEQAPEMFRLRVHTSAEEDWPLAGVQRAALARARDLLSTELQRMQSILDRR